MIKILLQILFYGKLGKNLIEKIFGMKLLKFQHNLTLEFPLLDRRRRLQKKKK
jgi:hypothetical protein